MKSSSSAAVIAVGIAATLIFGMGLATHVTQNVVAQGQDDDRHGGFDLKDWCAIELVGDILTIRAGDVDDLDIDIQNAHGNRGRPLGTGTPAVTPTPTPGTTDGLVGHLVSVRGAVEDGAWVAHVLNVKRQRCDPATGEPIDRPDRTVTPGTPVATHTRRPTRTPEETRTPRPTRDVTRTPGRPTDVPRRPDEPPGQSQGGTQGQNQGQNQGQTQGQSQGQGGGQDNDNRGRGRN